jgi:hypothetical protein
MSESTNRWLRIAHRASVALRAIAGDAYEEIASDNARELDRARKLLDLVARVGGAAVGQAPKQKTPRTQARRETH